MRPRIAGLGHGAPLLDDAHRVLAGLAEQHVGSVRR
ncbi:hypothetical protein J3R03_002736 [Actinoplanes couchii]|nr:hypothetical protein [Actinoplanes couchii]